MFQLECLFFKSLPQSLCNICQILRVYNTKIIHHFLEDNLIPTGLNIHQMNTKTQVSEQSSQAGLQEPHTQPRFWFVKT